MRDATAQRADAGVRERLFPLSWRLLWPVRQYLTRFPVQRGKGLIRRAVVEPLLPPDTCEFIVTGPLETQISLRYREALGFASLLYGGFETAEVLLLCRLIRTGSMAIDVGANVGLFTLPFARAVGDDGSALAFEPLDDNVRRLRANVQRNALHNVLIDTRALGDRCGTVELVLSRDPAYGSTADRDVFSASGLCTTVEMTRLDKVWSDLGNPQVSVLKVDVEGGELGVLRGAMELIRSQRPTILLECDVSEHLGALTELLATFAYECAQPPDFMPWNYLFQPEAGS